MPAHLKDYPLYVYDDPAIYKNFNGGINTNPNNEHLNDNELKDCLNMHYNSAGLIKRPGAKQICKITCDEDLLNIQSIFIFTHKISYILIAADGKLYKGLYNENITVVLKRLYIYSTTEDTLIYKSPTNMTIGLETYYRELTNQLHNGYICRNFFTKDNKVISPEDVNIRDIITECLENDSVPANTIIKYKTNYYTCPLTFTKYVIKPTNTTYWIKLNDTSINNYYPQIAAYYKKHPKLFNIQINNASDGGNIITYYTSTGIPNTWEEHSEDYEVGQIILYNDVKYLCIQTHNCITIEDGVYTPITSLPNIKQLYYKDSLIFQNKRSIEIATYNNICYIATGTRFVEVYLLNNQLQAFIVSPYKCSYNETANIGYNILSPYPEMCLENRYNQVNTSFAALLPIKNIYGSYELTPIATYENDLTENDMIFRWEKLIKGTWYTIVSFRDNYVKVNEQSENAIRLNADAENIYDKWEASKDYTVGDICYILDGNIVKVYQCHTDNKATSFDESNFNLLNQYTISNSTTEIIKYIKRDYSKLTVNDADIYKYRVTMCNELKNYEVNDTSILNKDYATLNNIDIELESIPKYIQDTNYILDVYDLVPDKINGVYSQIQSTLFIDAPPNNYFETIHSCSSIAIDGNKLLLYNDSYNSGSWYKTKIGNPYYISELGCLSFKTTKNESLVKVVNFSNNLIAFANTDTIGGSIHLVTGNGDDYTGDEFYSPYKRTTLSMSVTCDNPNTVQSCENYLFFKYFNNVYFIVSSDLSNDVISIYSANDKIKLESPYFTIPWDDNTCISEVTDDYYALIWKEKYELANDGIRLIHPAIKLKCYYKMAYTESQKVFFPWLRDESQYFNVDNIIYIKGKPVYLYNNILIAFDEAYYKDIDESYNCSIHFKGVDTNYPKLLKVLSNITVYYYRGSSSDIKISLKATNEAGHLLLDSSNQKKSLQDLKALRVGSRLDNNSTLNSTIVSTKVFNTNYKFPYLLIESTIDIESDDMFALSSMTYIYTSMDTPDTTIYDTYAQIIRKKEV